MAAATRSSPEWAASERMPRLPLLMPTMTLSRVIPTAAKTEFKATAFFSICIPAMLTDSAIIVIIHVPLESANSDPAASFGLTMCYIFYYIHLLRPQGGTFPEEH